MRIKFRSVICWDKEVAAAKQVEATDAEEQGMSTTEFDCTDPECGCKTPTFTEAYEALRFLSALAEHGLRCDMNPTHDMSSLDASEAFWHRYLRMLDANIRQLATNALEAAPSPPDSPLVVGPADSSQGEPAPYKREVIDVLIEGIIQREHKP